MTGFGEPTWDDVLWIKESWPTIAPDVKACMDCLRLDGRGKWEFWPCPKHASKEGAA